MPAVLRGGVVLTRHNDSSRRAPAATSTNDDDDDLGEHLNHERADTNTAAYTSNTTSAVEALNPCGTTAPQPEQSKRRRPSPGLAARLKALGFGKEAASRASTVEQEGEGLDRSQADHQEQPASRQSLPARLDVVPAERRGRPGSNLGTPNSDLVRVVESPVPAPQMMADARVESSEGQKYRWPEHANGNGTEAMADTKQAHLDRSAPAGEDNTATRAIPSKDMSGAAEAPADADEDGSPSYFNPFGRQRAGSIYTLSRASFASQLAQLTSLQLPDADSLSSRIAALPSSKAASAALMSAAGQIRSWISKASEVITGLDGEDDVEWAAAGGREGLEEVDGAITRFERLIRVYVGAMESLQQRCDLSSLEATELLQVVSQVEIILSEWNKIKRSLKNVKNAVEIAMEWEELWNTVLGDIGNEVDVLSRLVFEMEEKRHRTVVDEASSGHAVDLIELETIVEETPAAKSKTPARTTVGMPPFPHSPCSPSTPPLTQDDSSLLALFARMQPLRASLDFLPMRLAGFLSRAEQTFPTACEELEDRRRDLEASWKALEKDAESLRRELGEDRWILVFRGAGRQAQKMCESVDRSRAKLKESVDAGMHLNNPSIMGKKIESYEAKKTHYGPAIERVLTIIERGVKDRLTVNGEVLRLHADMQHTWEDLKVQLHELDAMLEEMQSDRRNQQLRDSISSIVSNDRSTLRSSNDTPGSSPASSVVMGLSGGLDPVKQGGRSSSKDSLPNKSKRFSGALPHSALPRASPQSRTSVYASTSPSTRVGASTPMGHQSTRTTSTNNADSRPRWNASTNTKDTMIGHNFKPLSLTTPSPHAKQPPSTHSNRSARLSASIESKIPLRSPLSRDSTASPDPHSTPSRISRSRLGIRNLTSPGPYSQEQLNKTPISSTRRPLHSQHSMSSLTTNRRTSLQVQGSSDTTNAVSTPSKKMPPRPASSLTMSKRGSLLPTPKSEPRGRVDSSGNGRESPFPTVGTASAMLRHASQPQKGADRRPWR